MKRLWVARLDAASIGHPEDGEYIWISTDGQTWLEVNRAPDPEHEDETYADLERELRDGHAGEIPEQRYYWLQTDVRLLHHAGATITPPEGDR